MQKFFEKIDPLIVFCFGLHDFLSDCIAKHLVLIKRTILIVAFVSLFFVFYPAVRRSFGNFAEVTLFFILFLSPLSKIFRTRLLLQLMGLRREFGILMGCFALVHGLAYFVDPASFSLNIAPYWKTDFFAMQPLYYLGILALVLTLPLLFTSNNASLRSFGAKKWKILHRIVYILFLVVLLHVFFIRGLRHGQQSYDIIQPVAIILSYGLLKVLAWKNFIAPLRDMIVYVSERHRQYTFARNIGSAPITP